MNSFVIGRRAMIVAFWVLVIGLFLYFPKFISKILSGDKEINLVTFTGIVSPEMVKHFKLKTGIDVRVTHFETNEELVAKLKISKGKGYDLLIASDYLVEILRADSLVQELDYEKLPNLKFVDSRILNKYFDPENKFSVPVSWAIYGLGYDKKIFGELKKASWELIFDDPKLRYRICMLDDAREAIYFASLYLFKKLEGITDKELASIKALLLEQKKWVEAYSNEWQDYFLSSRTVPLVVIPSDGMRKRLRTSGEFGFILPTEGSLMAIENIMLSSSSDKSELAHKFINYILDKDVSLMGSKEYSYYPVNVEAQALLDKEFYKEFFELTSEQLKKIGILKSYLPRRKIEDLWLSIKAS